MSIINIRKRIKEESNPEQAKILQRFFKTGKGEYGEGDIFAGIKVPVQRKIARENRNATIKELYDLLHSPVHEERLIALFILIDKFSKADETHREQIYNFYMKNRKGINNWDLVDLSAPLIAGAFLYDKARTILYEVAESENIWERRIAILSTFYFIRKNDFKDTLAISEILLNDKHDLIHKAVGWMLRETGKRNLKVEESFLKKHYKKMPRTMLRYAIEKFPEEIRQNNLKGRI